LSIAKFPILLLRPDKAGDALKTIPVIRNLVAKAPEYDIHLLTSEHNVSLFVYEPNLKVFTLPKNWLKMKSTTLRGAMRELSLPEKFSHVVNLLCDPSPGIELLFSSISSDAYFSNSPIEFGPSVTPLSLPEGTPAGRSETENIARLVSEALKVDIVSDLSTVPRGPVLTNVDKTEALEKMGLKQGRWLGFCPLAGTEQRTPPLKRWQKFVHKVTQDTAYEKFFIFGTPRDYKLLQQLREGAARKDAIECVFPSSFRTLGAYLRRLDAVVAVDSGPLHLAHSLGVTSLGFLSGGDQARWFPQIGEHDHLLRRGIFNRFPTALEMLWAYQKWNAQFTAAEPIGLGSPLPTHS